MLHKLTVYLFYVKRGTAAAAAATVAVVAAAAAVVDTPAIAADMNHGAKLKRSCCRGEARRGETRRGRAN